MWKLVFACLVLVIGQINGQKQNSTCQFAAPYVNFTARIPDDFTVSQNPIICQVTGKIDLQDGSYKCNDYFLLTKTGNNLSLSVNESFKNFEEDVFNHKKISKVSSYFHINEHEYIIHGSCDGKDSHSGTHVDLLMSYTIIDNNNHKPEFVQVPSYKVALPVMPGFDITNNNTILVRDKDLTTQNLTVEIDNDSFEARYARYGNNSHFIISAKKIWNKNGDFKLKLTAKDERGLASEPITINVTIDQQGSLDVPTFEKVIYNVFDQKENVDETIKYQSNKPESVKIELIDDTKNAFKVVNDPKTKTIRFTGKLPTSEKLATVGLKITSDVSATSAVIVTHKS